MNKNKNGVFGVIPKMKVPKFILSEYKRITVLGKGHNTTYLYQNKDKD